jgi:hypothetical protein
MFNSIDPELTSRFRLDKDELTWVFSPNLYVAADLPLRGARTPV